ncbi:oligosaccharide flippase family protein [Rhizorhapis sp. SPR117]|uniref:oligosaccharide flippase family protein n=1 Tax=Rhizorhapis sp. SPR117 TaxID=2912611 RepID=UPI001F3F04A0|nr:oligosaccharide flippase family protein [Rhizorhapis sp. SPR117]
MTHEPKPQSGHGRRGTKAFLMASGVAQLCALARYTVLARILGPEQLGLAAILILTAQFFESVTDSGSDRFLVQDRGGDDPALMNLVHLISFGRGLLIAVGLILLAGPISRLSGAPQLAPEMAILAISSLIMGFVHWDFRRQQRSSDFRGEGNIIMYAEIGSLIATTVAVLIVRDFTAILYGLIARSLVTVVVSHIIAQRRYAMGYARPYAPRLARFAWPLIINGLLIFIGGQGDRIFISNQLGVAELGHYSAVALLIFYPSGMLARFMATAYLPRISARHSDPAAWDRASRAFASQTVLIGIAMQFGFVLVAPFAVPILYGTRFEIGLLPIALIAILQTIRFIRTWPGTAAIGAGLSHIVMINNIVRMIAFPAAIAGLALLGGMEGIISGFIFAECLAFMVGLVMVNRALGRPLMHGGSRFLYFASGAMLLLLTIQFFGQNWWNATGLTAAALVIWAVLLVRSEWEALMKALALLDGATGHRIVPSWILRNTGE